MQQYAALLRDLRMVPNPSDKSPYPRPAHSTATTRGVTLEGEHGFVVMGLCLSAPLHSGTID